jgi:hypothetical protein
MTLESGLARRASEVTVWTQAKRDLSRREMRLLILFET